jgi:uncharacterized protein (DUF362 family)
MAVKVFLISGSNRAESIRELMKQFELSKFGSKDIAVKANYNSADPFPASTHLETLRTIIEGLQEIGVRDIALAERSGMGDTLKVLVNCGVMTLAEEYGVDIKVLDEAKKEEWFAFHPEGSHWKRGFLMAKTFLEVDKIIQTCCLKTHRFGGHFTLSLKNSVGMIAKFDPTDNYNFMNELHSSPYQREMIAEINSVYQPAFVIMDGIKAFVEGGPASGKMVSPNVILASTDRIAIDTVGIAILRHFGTTPQVATGPIFSHPQIKRAVELNLGVTSAQEIQLISLDKSTTEIKERISNLLQAEESA